MPYQQYLGVTNLLTTKLSWRRGPINVMITDMAVMGDCLPTNAGQEKSPGQYIKRFSIKNDGAEHCRAVFAVYVHAEVNGGVGDVGFSWHDSDKAIQAINRGHPHANKKLARDATIEFALALDDRGESSNASRPGPNEAILFRPVELARRRRSEDRHAGERRVHGLERRPGHVRALAETGTLAGFATLISTRSSTSRAGCGTISSSRFRTCCFPSRRTAFICGGRRWRRRCMPTPRPGRWPRDSIAG